MSDATSAQPKKGFHFGYCVVATLVMTSFIPLSLALSCAGIFYPAVSADIGVGPGMLSYYTSLIAVSNMLSLGPLGRWLNNGNARACLTTAAAIMVAAFVLLSFTTALWQFYVAAFAMGIGTAMFLFLAPSTLINRWFAKRAGFLLGIVMAFTGIGGVVWSTVGGILINAIGWRSTYLVFAGLVALCIPMTLFMVASRPSDKGLLPWGYEADKDAEVDAKPSQELTGMAAEEAFKTPSFKLIMAMTFIMYFGMFVYFLIPSYAASLPLSEAFPLLGATAASVAMVGQTVSKISLGAIGEGRPHGAAFCGIAVGIVGIALFAFGAGSMILFYVAAFIFGFFYGVTNVMTPIITRLNFGDRDYARIYSRISIASSVGSGVSGFIWGAVVDATGTFMVMFAGAILFMVVDCIIVLALKRIHDKARV